VQTLEEQNAALRDEAAAAAARSETAEAKQRAAAEQVWPKLGLVFYAEMWRITPHIHGCKVLCNHIVHDVAFIALSERSSTVWCEIFCSAIAFVVTNHHCNGFPLVAS
jgi:hypothetical protein